MSVFCFSGSVEMQIAFAALLLLFLDGKPEGRATAPWGSRSRIALHRGERGKDMKKHSVKSFVCGFLCAILVTAFVMPALASTGAKNLTATFNNIQVKLDGKLLNLHDAAGKTVEPFVIDGTTYLPIRAISEALGLGVDWNGSSNTVILTSKPEETPVATQGEKTSMASLSPFSIDSLLSSDLTPPTPTVRFSSGATFYNRQVKYTTDNLLEMNAKGFWYTTSPDRWPSSMSATYLVGNYSTFTAYVSSIDGFGDTWFSFYDADAGSLLKNIAVKQGEPPVQINIDLTGVDKLKIVAGINVDKSKHTYNLAINGALYNAYLIA